MHILFWRLSTLDINSWFDISTGEWQHVYKTCGSSFAASWSCNYCPWKWVVFASRCRLWLSHQRRCSNPLGVLIFFLCTYWKWEETVDPLSFYRQRFKPLRQTEWRTVNRLTKFIQQIYFSLIFYMKKKCLQTVLFHSNSSFLWMQGHTA